jgi:hypothetical protein
MLDVGARQAPVVRTGRPLLPGRGPRPDGRADRAGQAAASRPARSIQQRLRQGATRIHPPDSMSQSSPRLAWQAHLRKSNRPEADRRIPIAPLSWAEQRVRTTRALLPIDTPSSVLAVTSHSERRARVRRPNCRPCACPWRTAQRRISKYPCRPRRTPVPVWLRN